MRAPVHYFLSVIVLSLYGGQVCPFIEGLTLGRFGFNLLVIYALLYFARIPLRSRFVIKAPPESRVKNTFFLEIVLFVAGGLLVTFSNMALYDFPLGSGAKMVIGSVTLGFFAAVDIALECERDLFNHYARSGDELPVSDDYFPLTTQFSFAATVIIVMMMGVITLVIFHDMLWLSSVTPAEMPAAHTAILYELLFIAVVTLAEVLNLIAAVSGNLTLFFGSQNGALNAATSGDLTARVTVGANHEFGSMGRYTNQMIARLQRRTEELAQTRDVTILTLASLAETRDNETGAHILRTQRYVKSLALWLQTNGAEEYRLDSETLDLIYKSAPLHDIGKVGIPDAILLKPGKLTDEEFAIMKGHPAYGRDALMEAEKVLGANSFLRFAREIAYSHHEKWDGSGYPEGLQEDAIPLSARLMAVADVYDALISKRVYKPAFSPDKTESIIIAGRGSHFDPALTDAFEACTDEFRVIAAEYRSG